MSDRSGQPTIKEAMTKKAKGKDDQTCMKTRSRNTSPAPKDTETSSDESEGTFERKTTEVTQNTTTKTTENTKDTTTNVGNNKPDEQQPATSKAFQEEITNIVQQIKLNGEPISDSQIVVHNDIVVEERQRPAPQMLAASQSTGATCGHNVLAPFRNATTTRRAQLNEDLTAQILLNGNNLRNNQIAQAQALPDPIGPGLIRSDDLLQDEVIPFTDEQNLPPFEHGSKAVSYFNVLRGLLSKTIRATIHLQSLTENKRRHQIPRGLKINKPLNAVEASHTLKIQMMQILGEAENKILESLIEHYQIIIPKLEGEFKELYNIATNTLSPLDKRLVVIKLAHFRNELVQERRKITTNKQTANQQNPNDQGHQVPRDNQPENNQNTRNNQQSYNQNTRNNQMDQDWNTGTTSQSNMWEERPKPQRSGPQRRGKERSRNQRWR